MASGNGEGGCACRERGGFIVLFHSWQRWGWSGLEPERMQSSAFSPSPFAYSLGNCTSKERPKEEWTQKEFCAAPLLMRDMITSHVLRGICLWVPGLSLFIKRAKDGDVSGRRLGES